VGASWEPVETDAEVVMTMTLLVTHDPVAL
jgi:hypothetical protein